MLCTRDGTKYNTYVFLTYLTTKQPILEIFVFKFRAFKKHNL